MHGYGDHLEPEVLGYREVAVVSRDGAEELAVLYLLPGCSAADSVGHSVAYQLIHQREAAVTSDDGVDGVRPHHVRQYPLRLGYSVKSAVVAAVLTVLAVEYAGRARPAF